MMEYARHILQDALETNWGTARHANLIVFQDVERGKLSWRNPDQNRQSSDKEHCKNYGEKAKLPGRPQNKIPDQGQSVHGVQPEYMSTAIRPYSRRHNTKACLPILFQSGGQVLQP